MKNQSKPLLHNGFQVYDGCEVVGRTEKSFFTEVYDLSNGKSLYLFTDLEVGKIPRRCVNFDVQNIKVEGQKYISVEVQNHSSEQLAYMRELFSTQIGFDCVAGMDELKDLLINDVIQPLLNPEKYKKFKLSIPNGILLFGPPGCGKTFIVRKMSEELNYNFVEVKHSDVASPYIHGGVGKIGKLFEMAMLKSPSIVFIDEIEGILPKREALDSSNSYKQEEINEFLMHLNDAGNNGILVVGATNRPHLIDVAILRSGRMDKRIFVPPPDHTARKELFHMYLKDRPHEETVDLNKLAEITKNFVSSDIELIITEAARTAIKMNMEHISEDIIVAIIDTFNPSIHEEEMGYYKQFMNLERW